ncbi:Na+/H+ antiporter subunit E [Roseateles sp. DAIF2]|nr:Na+/H+ antiporter subunit E [Roseateles sp. DAIF2]
MKRLFPNPLLSAALAALWLLLNQPSPGHLLIALLLAILMPLLSAPLRPQRGAVRRPWVLARLILTVGGDVQSSALQVARGVLAGRRRPPNGRFVRIPLALRDAHALAALAVITTAVPGTVWSELAADRSSLLLHVFDLQGEEADFIAQYKQRYEQPLLEIFEA